jgi:hypothetical protein
MDRHQIIQNAKAHFLVITRHKWEVMKGCFKVGLYWQGLTHDLSKYSPTEFCIGVYYFQGGKRSPNAAERELKGGSTAWMHHKGRNKHHYEYWSDVSREKGHYVCQDMPTKYFVEMVMDRMAASKIYKGEEYNDSVPLQYLHTGLEKEIMNPKTYKKLENIFIMLAEKGENYTYRYIRRNLLRKRK